MSDPREALLWRKAFDPGTTDAEATGCIVAWHRLVLKRVRNGEEPPECPSGDPGDADDEDLDEDLRAALHAGLRIADLLGLLPRRKRK